MNKVGWRRPESVLPFTTAILIFVVWPLYRVIVSNLFVGGEQIPNNWWFFTAIYFGSFLWLETVALGTKIADILGIASSLLLGALAASVIALGEPSMQAPLHRIGFKYGPWFILLPLLYLHVVVEVMLVKRSANISSRTSASDNEAPR
jgi:hypothetical protein